MLDYLSYILQMQAENMSVFCDMLIIFILPIIMINRLTKLKSISDYYRKVIVYGVMSLSVNFSMLWYGASLNIELDKFLRFSSLFNTFVVLTVIAVIQVAMLCLKKDDLRKEVER